jgi:hypothetical protein
MKKLELTLLVFKLIVRTKKSKETLNGSHVVWKEEQLIDNSFVSSTSVN